MKQIGNDEMRVLLKQLAGRQAGLLKTSRQFS